MGVQVLFAKPLSLGRRRSRPLRGQPRELGSAAVGEDARKMLNMRTAVETLQSARQRARRGMEWRERYCERPATLIALTRRTRHRSGERDAWNVAHDRFTEAFALGVRFTARPRIAAPTREHHNRYRRISWARICRASLLIDDIPILQMPRCARCETVRRASRPEHVSYIRFLCAFSQVARSDTRGNRKFRII